MIMVRPVCPARVRTMWEKTAETDSERGR